MLGTTHSAQANQAVPLKREHVVDLSVELTKEEYHQASQALAEFLKFTLQLNLFGIVVLNHKDYFNAYNAQLNAFAHRRETNKPLDIETIIIELNQRLTNFWRFVKSCVKSWSRVLVALG
jgi:uracil DNA glycosylase